MSLLQYHRHHKLLDHLPPPSVLPFLERVGAPEHACPVDYHRHHSAFSVDIGLPDFKSLLDDISGGETGSGGEAGSSSLRGWNPLSTSSTCSPNNPPRDDTISHGAMGEDLLDNTDVFQPSFDPFIQDPWTLPKFLQSDIDDDFPYVPVNTSAEIEGRRRIEYVASKLNISCGESVPIDRSFTQSTNQSID